MVDWAAALAFTETAVADTFDVTACTFSATKPGLSGNHAREADASRPAFTRMVTIHLQPPSDILRRHEPSDPASGKTVSYDAVLTGRVTDWPWQPQRFDLVEADGQSWRVEASERDGSARPAFYLTRVRRAGS